MAAVPTLTDTHGVTQSKRRDDEHALDIEDKFDAPYDSAASNATSETDLHAKWYEPPDTYESKHRWDPRATWTPEEENKLRRKLDWRVAAFACLCFGALQLDRGNITNALSDNMLGDLKLTTKNYNYGQTIFYLCFLSAELPSQMISKKLGSDVWIPIQMMLWSAVAIGQTGLTGKNSFYATRALLGLLEGGFIADTILYLSYYYTSTELTIRLSWFWSSYIMTNILGSLLAAGLLKLRGHHGLAGWRWLFAIEGALTFLIGIVAYFYLPASPTQTAGGLRGKGWFTEREEIIIVNKVLRDDPTKSSMHNREGISLKDLWNSLIDWDLWPLYLIGLTINVASGTVGAYFTLNLKSLGFSTFHTNLLTIPYNVLWILMALGLARLSKRLNERVGVASLQAWWFLIFLIILITIPDNTSKWARWAVSSLLLAFPYAHPILVSMNSMNAGSVRTRTVASSLYNMFVQAASLVAANVYQPKDKPYYHKGNRVLLGIVTGSLFVLAFCKFWFVYQNKRRARIWDNLTVEERDEYIRTTTDKGNKRLDFRFLH